MPIGNGSMTTTVTSYSAYATISHQEYIYLAGYGRADSGRWPRWCTRSVLDRAPTLSGRPTGPSRLLAMALTGGETGLACHRLGLWLRFGVRPWRAATSKFSADPRLEAKVREVVGLHRHAPAANADALLDVKPPIQELERKALTLSPRRR